MTNENAKYGVTIHFSFYFSFFSEREQGGRGLCYAELSVTHPLFCLYKN